MALHVPLNGSKGRVFSLFYDFSVFAPFLDTFPGGHVQKLVAAFCNFWVPLKNLPEILKYTQSDIGKMPVIIYKLEIKKKKERSLDL